MVKKKKGDSLPSKAQVEEFEMLFELLKSLSLELNEFAKKKPDDALNKLKIKMVNRVLEKAKNVLKLEATIEFLDLLDEESIPSNSDAVIIIGQFQAAMRHFKEMYFGYDGGTQRWFTKD